VRLLVTGGSGFLGRNLVEHLSCQHEVLAPRHSDLDLTDTAAVANWFQAHDIDIVIHGAVRPGHRNASDPTQQLWSNLRMFFNIARNSEHFRRLIFLSSGAVYDIADAIAGVREEDLDRTVPADEHGFSKYVIAKHIERMRGDGSLDAVELRLFGIYGKHEDYAIRFISNAICKTLYNLPITLKQNRTFSYLFVGDLMPVIDHFLKYQASEAAYNVVPDATDDLLDLAERVKRRSGKDLPIRVREPGSGLPYWGTNDLLRREIPGVSFTPIDSAVDQLYLWYEQRIDTIERTVLLTDK
jgi:UDP-glucose 4-epimerase